MDKPKVKIKEKKKDEDNFDFMKCNKDNINNVIRDENTLTIINDLVNRIQVCYQIKHINIRKKII